MYGPQISEKCIFGALPIKSSLAVILSGQPSFYDYRLTRYGFGNFFAPPRLFQGYFWLTNHDPKNSTCFFWLS